MYISTRRTLQKTPVDSTHSQRAMGTSGAFNSCAPIEKEQFICLRRNYTEEAEKTADPSPVLFAQADFDKSETPEIAEKNPHARVYTYNSPSRAGSGKVFSDRTCSDALPPRARVPEPTTRDLFLRSLVRPRYRARHARALPKQKGDRATRDIEEIQPGPRGKRNSCRTSNSICPRGL